MIKLSKDAFEIFKDTWEEQIAKIEKEALDSDAVYSIRLDFHKGKIFLEATMMENKFTREVIVELNSLESKLNVALETARSRFKLRHRGILARIFGGIFDKIPKK